MVDIITTMWSLLAQLLALKRKSVLFIFFSFFALCFAFFFSRQFITVTIHPSLSLSRWKMFYSQHRQFNC